MKFYFHHTLAWCLAIFFSRNKKFPINILLDIDILLYSDVNILANKNCFLDELKFNYLHQVFALGVTLN